MLQRPSSPLIDRANQDHQAREIHPRSAEGTVTSRFIRIQPSPWSMIRSSPITIMQDAIPRVSEVEHWNINKTLTAIQSPLKSASSPARTMALHLLELSMPHSVFVALSWAMAVFPWTPVNARWHATVTPPRLVVAAVRWIFMWLPI